MAARYWEIDLLRTAAIGLMVVYHVTWDLDFLAEGLGPDPFGGVWRGVQVACGSLFLLVVGLSFTISEARARARGLGGRELFVKHVRRAGWILVLAGGVSVATAAVVGDRWVRFGILHLIGVALILAPALARLGRWLPVVGVAVIAAGLALLEVRVGTSAFLPLGVRPDRVGVDYYPLLPWLGVVMLGLWLGGLLYPAGRRGSWARRLPVAPPAAARVLGAPGRHSLALYLVHQPVLIALLAAALAVAGVEVTLA